LTTTVKFCLYSKTVQ